MAALAAVFAIQASALEYNISAPEDYLFGQATSIEAGYTAENPNVDRSKNTALIPPEFGSPTSYLPGSGEALTPNLVPDALGGGLTPSAGGVTYPTVSVTTPSGSYTAVTSDLYYSGGYLGTLSIPRIGLNVKVYEGTGSASLAKGVGHFTGTSIWDGNIGVAGHNRGVNTYFGQIHTLKTGDTIRLTTKLGTRTYSVSSVQEIRDTDTSVLAATAEDCLTLVTCVRDQPAYRWCVRARVV